MGKLADVIVLSEDLFTISPQRISTVAVEQTFIEGQRVYPKAYPAASP